MDMTDPEGPARFLYTADYFTAVRQTLRGGQGIFVMHGESPAVRQAAFACIGNTLGSVFPVVSTATTFVPMYGTLWSFRYGLSTDMTGQIKDPAILSPTEVDARISARMETVPVLTRGAMWPALFAPDPILVEAENHPQGRVITDGQPDFPDSFER
jgi:spermidine synthase